MPEADGKAAEGKVVAKKTTTTCIKGNHMKKVTAVEPKCPAGYQKKQPTDLFSLCHWHPVKYFSGTLTLVSGW